MATRICSKQERVVCPNLRQRAGMLRAGRGQQMKRTLGYYLGEGPRPASLSRSPLRYQV